MPPATDAAFFGGFIAGEGHFHASPQSSRFTFALALGASDAEMCTTLQEFLGVGRIWRYQRRRAHYDDEIVFRVQRLVDLVEVVVPFMDAHLPASHKRDQYLAWREKLLDYWHHRAKRQRACIVDGCDRPRRAHGLCRQHLYRARRV